MQIRSMLILSLLVTVTVSAASPITTVILVRHAEKAGPTGDVPLSSAGAERAQELVRVLAGTSINAVYATPYVRTQSTATPLAKAHGLEPIIITANDAYPKTVVDTLMKDHKGETVVVVGHSNTTVDVLKRLGVPNPPTIPDSEYDDLFLVSIADGAAPKLIALRYGAVAR